MSETVKTWDGLRVWKPLWYPKHPQLMIKAIPEHPGVPDARPRQIDTYVPVLYGLGSFCLTSPNGTYYTVYLADDGAMKVDQVLFGAPQPTFYIGSYVFTVDNDGALHVWAGTVVRNTRPWPMMSPSRLQFTVDVDSDLAVLVSLVSGPVYMDGTFTLVSPNGTSYVVYIADDGAVIVTAGTWGPSSTSKYIGNAVLTVDNDGALHVSLSGETHVDTFRMVSAGGYEYMFTVDNDLALKVGREGHWWDIQVLVTPRPQIAYELDDVVTEDSQNVWTEE